jgi:hypothetical protein
VQKKQLILLTAGVVIVLAGVFSVAISAGGKKSEAACQTIGAHHTVVIQQARMSVPKLQADRCDRLTIKNLDPETREIGFGDHDHHEAYDGVSEKILRQGDSLTITLRATGEHHYHDHYHHETEASFVVR